MLWNISLISFPQSRASEAAAEFSRLREQNEEAERSFSIKEQHCKYSYLFTKPIRTKSVQSPFRVDAGIGSRIPEGRGFSPAQRVQGRGECPEQDELFPTDSYIKNNCILSDGNKASSNCRASRVSNAVRTYHFNTKSFSFKCPQCTRRSADEKAKLDVQISSMRRQIEELKLDKVFYECRLSRCHRYAHVLSGSLRRFGGHSLLSLAMHAS